MTDSTLKTQDPSTARGDLAPMRDEFCQLRALHQLRERAAQEHRVTRRLNDAITALLLLVAFPFGFALLALSIVFGRSLPRALAAVAFMAAVNLTALANSMFFKGDLQGVLSNDSGLLDLLVTLARAQGLG